MVTLQLSHISYGVFTESVCMTYTLQHPPYPKTQPDCTYCYQVVKCMKKA